MNTVWGNMLSIIYYSFLKPHISSKSYCFKIDIMYQKLTKKQLASINLSGPILLHDNARLHILIITTHKSNNLGYKILLYLLYFSDHLFKHLKIK